MIAFPPESSRARLLKLRRAHREFATRNRQRELGPFVLEKPEHGVGCLSLYVAVGSGCAPAKDPDVIPIAIQVAR